MPTDPELRSHQDWLGMVQPVGLVASARALAAAGAFIDRAGLIALQQKFEALTEQKRDEDPILPDLPSFCLQVLGWEPADLAGAPGGPELPDSLAVSLPEYGEVLSPTYAVPDPDRPGEWLMLIKTAEAHTGLDSAARGGENQWHASRSCVSSACCARPAFRSACSATPSKSGWSMLRARSPPGISRSGKGDVRSGRASDPRRSAHVAVRRAAVFRRAAAAPAGDPARKPQVPE